MAMRIKDAYNDVAEQAMFIFSKAQESRNVRNGVAGSVEFF